MRKLLRMGRLSISGIDVVLTTFMSYKISPAVDRQIFLMTREPSVSRGLVALLLTIFILGNPLSAVGCFLDLWKGIGRKRFGGKLSAFLILFAICGIYNVSTLMDKEDLEGRLCLVLWNFIVIARLGNIFV